MILSPITTWIYSIIITLPTLSLSGISQYVELVYDVLSVVCYVIPVYALMPLIHLSLAIVGVKLALAILRLVIDIVPLW